MTFEEMLDQAMAMLQRRGRMTYRALKLQFNLDDDRLEALKDEILYAHPYMVHDDGRGLVWTGDARLGSLTSYDTPCPGSAPGVTAGPAHADLLPLSRAAPSRGERRQLTVLFCDLVDSTALASQLDPEDWREVVRAYQSTCAEVIQRFDGYIAQYLGDGLLVYFGYPQAHEDDAQRAVQAGLGMLEAMGTLHTRLAQDKSLRLAVRIGIHTGLVVVGEMGGGGRQEHLALGTRPMSRPAFRELAGPDTVADQWGHPPAGAGVFYCGRPGSAGAEGCCCPGAGVSHPGCQRGAEPPGRGRGRRLDAAGWP